MKKLISIFILCLLASITYAQTAPVQVSQPQKFLKYILFQDSVVFNNLAQGNYVGHLSVSANGKGMLDTVKYTPLSLFKYTSTLYLSHDFIDSGTLNLPVRISDDTIGRGTFIVRDPITGRTRRDTGNYVSQWQRIIINGVSQNFRTNPSFTVPNIYNADGTLTHDRYIADGGYILRFGNNTNHLVFKPSSLSVTSPTDNSGFGSDSITLFNADLSVIRFLINAKSDTTHIHGANPIKFDSEVLITQDPVDSLDAIPLRYLKGKLDSVLKLGYNYSSGSVSVTAQGGITLTAEGGVALLADNSGRLKGLSITLDDGAIFSDPISEVGIRYPLGSNYGLYGKNYNEYLPDWYDVQQGLDSLHSVISGGTAARSMNADSLNHQPGSYYYAASNPNSYISANQTITFSGDVSGSGTTAVTLAVNKLNGQLPSYYLSRANQTGTQAAGTITGLAAVATSGAYTDLTGKPSIYTFTGSGSQYTKGDGTYATFPTNVSNFSNDAGYYNSSSSIPWSKISSTPTSLAGYGITDPVALTTTAYSNPSFVNSLAYSKLTGAPNLATVATSGSYNDLLSKPAIYTFTGTNLQYARGDGTYATFPTDLSSFGNSPTYQTAANVTTSINALSGVYYPLSSGNSNATNITTLQSQVAALQSQLSGVSLHIQTATYSAMTSAFTTSHSVVQFFDVLSDTVNTSGYPAQYSYSWSSTDNRFILLRIVPQSAN